MHKPNYFAGDVWDERPRRLWQVLFNLYRDGGGSLTHMSNMLVDLQCCAEAMDRTHNGDVVFYWGFDENARFGITRWRWVGEEVSDNPELAIAIMGTDKNFRFVLTRDGYSFEQIFSQLGE